MAQYAESRATSLRSARNHFLHFLKNQSQFEVRLYTIDNVVKLALCVDLELDL